MAFIDQKTIEKQWDDLNYLEAPDLKIAREEYTQFEQILKDEGIKIHHLPQDEELTIDSIYCRDAALTTDRDYFVQYGQRRTQKRTGRQ